MNKWTTLVMGAFVAGMMSSQLRANEAAPPAEGVAPEAAAPAADATAPKKGKKMKKKKGMACKGEGKCKSEAKCKGEAKGAEGEAK